MNVITKNISEITPYDKNTKKHDQTQINNVAESIKKYGFVQPIVIDKNGVIVIGHCRALAAKKLKMKEVPCVCVEDLTEEQVRALRIIDNKTNESEWDMDLLPVELPDLDLSDFDLDFGIEEEEDDEIVEDELRAAIRELTECEETDIIREHKPLKNDLHPTMKPLKLLGKFIRNSTKRGEIVLDLFGGSGSTLMTCEQTGRKCYMMELDPKYVDVIVKRWEDFTGEKAIQIEGENLVYALALFLLENKETVLEK